MINRHKAWLIKDGVNTRIYADQWLRSGHRLWQLPGGGDDMRVAHLMKDDEQRWDEVKISSMFPEEVGRRVKATPIHDFLVQDTPIWPFTRDGCYSVKTGYHIIASELLNPHRPSPSSPDSQAWICKSIWNANVQPKIKHFMWKLLSNSLPTKVNLL